MEQADSCKGKCSKVRTLAVKLPLDSAPSLVAEFAGLVPREKREKMARFVKPVDALRTLFGELLVRGAACTEWGLRNREIAFRAEASGKPVFAGSKPFFFNISHSGDWVVCSISRGEVGVDVERIHPVNVESLGRFYSPEERDELARRDEAERLPLFFDIWTVKESYLKAIGTGLRRPLSSFTVSFQAGCTGIEKEGEPVEGIFFRCYPVDPGYRLHVCAFEDRFADELEILDPEEVRRRFDPVEAHCFD